MLKSLIDGIYKMTGRKVIKERVTLHWLLILVYKE